MRTLKQPSLARFPIRLLTFALVLTAASVCWLASNSYSAYRFIEDLKQRQIRCVELRGVIVHLDEVLTMSARMAAATGDLKWEKRYRHFETQLDEAIKEATRLAPQPALAKLASQTDDANVKLVEMENRSFEFVRHGELAQARAVLFSDAYEEQKTIYAEGIGLLLEALNKQWSTKLYTEGVKIRLSILSSGVVLVALVIAWYAVVRMLARWREALATSNAALESEIAEHKRAKETAASLNQQLVDAARRAGMADVATSVLHNVGNVLNSVNISTALVVEKVRNSKAANVDRAAALLREHSGDLANFLVSDPKGRQLPEYLTNLAHHLANERALALRELEALTKNDEHIKQIVAMQQNYARVASVVEPLSPIELVEDALRLNKGSLSRHEVEVEREYAPTPVIESERHKTLQILVNLIRNAKQALDEGMPDPKRMIVRVCTNGDKTVKISVSDNGVGIAPENLTQVFSHGFTTRSDGHGFGLHSSALAAKEMGGKLTGHSDGPGRGATFTLELPYGNGNKPGQEKKR